MTSTGSYDILITGILRDLLLLIWGGMVEAGSCAALYRSAQLVDICASGVITALQLLRRRESRHSWRCRWESGLAIHRSLILQRYEQNSDSVAREFHSAVGGSRTFRTTFCKLGSLRKSHTGGPDTPRLWGCQKNRGLGFECDSRKKYQNPEKDSGSKRQDAMSVLQELSW